MSVQPVIIYRLDENPYREANLLCEVEKQQRMCQANEKVIAKQHDWLWRQTREKFR